MSKQRATKRQITHQQNDGKIPKMPLTDIEKTQEMIINTPWTATTMNLLQKKLLKLEELKLSSTLMQQSHSLFNSHPDNHTEDDDVSSSEKLLKLPISARKSRLPRSRVRDSGNSAEGIEDPFDSPSTSSKLDLSESVDVSKKDKFNPKNIKTPTMTSKLIPLMMKDVLNKNKCPQENIPLPRTVGSTSTSNKNKCPQENIPLPRTVGSTSTSNQYSSENIDSLCSLHSVFLEKLSPATKIYAGKRQQRKSTANICSVHSIEFSKSAIGKRCEKCDEEEMLLFFWRLLPLTVVLSEEKKQEFKGKVRATLEQLLDK